MPVVEGVPPDAERMILYPAAPVTAAQVIRLKFEVVSVALPVAVDVVFEDGDSLPYGSIAVILYVQVAAPVVPCGVTVGADAVASCLTRMPPPRRWMTADGVPLMPPAMIAPSMVASAVEFRVAFARLAPVPTSLNVVPVCVVTRPVELGVPPAIKR